MLPPEEMYVLTKSCDLHVRLDDLSLRRGTYIS